MASLRMSCLLNFRSGGWAGTNFRSSTKAPLTFCCRQRSLVLVNTRRTSLRPPPPPPVGEVREGGEEEEETEAGEDRKLACLGVEPLFVSRGVKSL